jgi:superfamily II DNA or RNA helicase
MNQTKGTIYLRDNSWFSRENVIKMGIASFAKDRSGTYITGEVERGYFKMVIEIPLEKMKIIDKILKSKFHDFNVYKGGGTEFYRRDIHFKIEEFLKTLDLEYRVLSNEEVNTMERCERVRNIKNKQNIKNLFNGLNVVNLIKKLKNKKIQIISEYKNREICLREYKQPNAQQQYVLDIIKDFYKQNDIGKLIWACGLGKALLSILIVYLLQFKSVVFGVPSKTLQKQIKNEILKIFPNKEKILFVGGDEDDGIKSTNNKEDIKSFLNLNNDNECKFVITTYHSCVLLVDNVIEIDFKIGDEAHHLVGIEKEEEKGFRKFHEITTTKSLFMTATEKTLETRSTKDIYSMEDEKCFGKLIDSKSVSWAIENKKITDYNILVPTNNEVELDKMISEVDEMIKIKTKKDVLKIVRNKDIFLAAKICLESFEKYSDLSHILLYTNTTEDAELAKKYIDEILQTKTFERFKKESVYNNALHSKNCVNLKSEIDNFKNASYGIISCVYIFGEGFDLPKLNGVCIAGNMQSEIRIVQYLLRPNRLEFGNPHKKAYIIIPYLDSDDWDVENKSYGKLKNIASQMKNVDENIEQKIFVTISTNKKQKKQKKKVENGETIYYEYEDSDDDIRETTKMKIRMRYSKALNSKLSEEQDEYMHVKSINNSLNIQSKKEYNECENIHRNFIKDPENYFKSKGVWTNWYDFMGVDTSIFIQSKQEWINFCKEKNIGSIYDYNNNCEKYNVLPKEPADFYNKGFTNIGSELRWDSNRRR